MLTTYGLTLIIFTSDLKLGFSLRCRCVMRAIKDGLDKQRKRRSRNDVSFDEESPLQILQRSILRCFVKEILFKN